MSQPDYKYWAFISYSHQDTAWALWLHRQLERYRVPRRLVGRPHWTGTIPRRLFPVFRDRDELPSSAELGPVINEALRLSRYQIVICSPNSAASRWVNEEIQYFKSLGRDDRLLCLIVDGEPHAIPGKGQLECFAPALKLKAGADGDAPVEPIAADARRNGDGRDNALLKLIAGLLDLPFDELKQRERRRQIWQRVQWAAAGVAFAAAIVGVAQWKQLQKQEELEAQALRTRIGALYQTGRQELLAHNEARAAVNLNEVLALGVDTPALRYMLGRALRAVDAQKLRFDSGSPVYWADISADSSRVFTIGENWDLQIWDARNGARLAHADLGDLEEVGALFSPGGSYIAVESVHAEAPEQRLRVFDAATGALRFSTVRAARVGQAILQRIDAAERWLLYRRPDDTLMRVDLQSGEERPFAGRYTTATFCGDGQSVLAARADGVVMRLDSQRGEVLQVYGGLRRPVVALDASHGCQSLAAGTTEGTFRLWDARDGRLLLAGGHTRAISNLTLSGDGARLMTLTRNSVSVWDARRGALIHSSKVLDPISNLATISPDARRLAVLRDSHLTLLDPLSGGEDYSLDGHQGSVQAFNFSADTRHFVSAGSDGSVAVWTLPDPAAELAQGAAVISTDEPDPAVVAQTLAGDRLFAGGADGRGTIWDGSVQQRLLDLDAHAAPLTAAVFSADGKQLATASADGEVRVRDTADGALLQRDPQVGSKPLQLQFNAGGTVLAVQIKGNRLRLWNLQEGVTLADLSRDESRAGDFSPDGNVYAYGADGVVTAWDLLQRKPRWSVPLPQRTSEISSVGVVAYSPDGTRMLVSQRNRSAWILDARDGRVLQRMDQPASMYFTARGFSPDGRQVFLTDMGKAVYLWEPDTGRKLTLGGHTAGVWSAAFSPDGALIVTAGDDGYARVWDVHSGELLDAFVAHDGNIHWDGAQFDVDGRRLLTAGTDDRVRLWPLPRETRNAQQIAQLLGCRVAWQVEGLALKPAALNAAAACSAAESAAVLSR